jgi:disulfide bond formation protein DsbB
MSPSSLGSTAPILIAAASAAILAAVFISQYGFGLEPCHLCLWQRLPYAIVLGLSPVAALVWQKQRFQPIILSIYGMVLLAGGALALYHVGIEQHWWAGTESCGSNDALVRTVEELRAALVGKPVARCDQPSFVFLGLSMAGWNLIAALGLAGFSFAAAAGHSK